MRTVNIAIPIIGWATATVDVSEEDSEEDILDDLRKGSLKFTPKVEEFFPLETVYVNIPNQFDNMNYPTEIEIEY